MGWERNGSEKHGEWKFDEGVKGCWGKKGRVEDTRQGWRRWSMERGRVGRGGQPGQNNRRVTFPACAAAHFVQQSGAGPRQERKKERVSSWSVGRS